MPGGLVLKIYMKDTHFERAVQAGGGSKLPTAYLDEIE
jgi:hypothetical protein